MGSPLSPMVANLFMEKFETKAISSATYPPRLWLRYANNTLIIQKATHSIQCLQHTNSIDLHIQFTQETPNTEGSIPFLDTLVSQGLDNTLLTEVYRKPTHID